MANLNHRLIFALAAVISVAGVLNLLTLPALAGQPISGPDCQALADDIRARALADAATADPPTIEFPNTCPNLCNEPPDEPVAGTTYQRKPGNSPGVPVATILEYADDEDEDLNGDLLYAATIFGPMAFFCDVALVDPEDVTSNIDSFKTLVVGVGYPSPADPSGQQTSCFLFNQLCTGP